MHSGARLYENQNPRLKENRPNYLQTEMEEAWKFIGKPLMLRFRAMLQEMFSSKKAIYLQEWLRNSPLPPPPRQPSLWVTLLREYIQELRPRSSSPLPSSHKFIVGGKAALCRPRFLLLLYLHLSEKQLAHLQTNKTCKMELT